MSASSTVLQQAALSVSAYSRIKPWLSPTPCIPSRQLLTEKTELYYKADNFQKLVGKDAEYNSQKIIEIFKGEDNDFSKAVSLNAAAGLIVSEKETNFKNAYEMSRNHLLSGKTLEHLKKLNYV